MSKFSVLPFIDNNNHLTKIGLDKVIFSYFSHSKKYGGCVFSFFEHSEVNSTEEEDKTIDEEAKEETPSIEEEIALAENIIEEEEEEMVNRWQVYASIAPVYYNTLGKGSHLDEQFNENSKSGEINASYGVNVSYAFNEKLIKKRNEI